MNDILAPEDHRPTLADRIRSRVAARRNGESGLALLDVLLGMAIFALIVIIAIQSIGQFRQRAFQTSANSDAQQLSIGLESYFTDNQAYPAVNGEYPDWDGAGTVAAATNATGLGVNLTKNDEILNYAANNASGTYSYCIIHKSGGSVDAWSYYVSSTGAIAASGRGAPTATSVATGNACL